jgi:peptidoglycan/xylan/chitin deacetylase (PgdA/CDA1 family)
LKVSQSLRDRLATPWLHCYRFVKKLAGPPVPGSFRILIFHNVSKSQYAAFERLLCYLLDEYGILTPGEAEARLHGNIPRGPKDKVPYLLTFDDGFKSNAGVATEILNRYGVQAVFFVCPGLMDVPPEEQSGAIVQYIFEGQVEAAKTFGSIQLMSWEDIELLVRTGHAVGSHTLFHRRLSELNLDDQRHEIFASADLLEKKLGIGVKWFAYPFGDLRSINQRSLQLMAKRYRFCCSGIRGINTSGMDHIGLLREYIDLNSPFEYQKLVLEGGLDVCYKARVRIFRRMVSDAAQGLKPASQA